MIESYNLGLSSTRDDSEGTTNRQSDSILSDIHLDGFFFPHFVLYDAYVFEISQSVGGIWSSQKSINAKDHTSIVFYI